MGYREDMTQLVNARKDLGLSQSEVARRMGVNHSVVARLEHFDSMPNPTYRTLERYADVLGADLRLWPMQRMTS